MCPTLALPVLGGRGEYVPRAPEFIARERRELTTEIESFLFIFPASQPADS